MCHMRSVQGQIRHEARGGLRSPQLFRPSTVSCLGQGRSRVVIRNPGATEHDKTFLLFPVSRRVPHDYLYVQGKLTRLIEFHDYSNTIVRCC